MILNKSVAHGWFLALEFVAVYEDFYLKINVGCNKMNELQTGSKNNSQECLHMLN